jgi:RNA 2',3'-cyclic 3'-phosphodiesterase
MQLFVGIPLAPDVIDGLERLTAGLRRSGDSLRWSSPETWHITLQFLGEVLVGKYECVVDELAKIRSPYVPIWLSGTGIFDRAGVFWAGVNVSRELRQLEKQVVAATGKCGFAAEDRPYHPHVTLARAKGDDRARLLRGLLNRVRQEAELPAFEAGEILLYESFTGSGGTRHEVRARFPLARFE